MTADQQFQTPGNYPEESMQHTEHGERLKSIKNFPTLKFQLNDGCDYLAFSQGQGYF